MPNPLQLAGAALPPSDFAPLHQNRSITGYWTNTNPLRDAATEDYTERFYGGRQDRIAAGENVELSPHLTLKRRCGQSVYNSQQFPAIRRFYGWNTFTLTAEAVRVMADTDKVVYDATGMTSKTAIWTKGAGAGSTYFLGVGNILYMTNGVENIQLNNATGVVTKWGIAAPATAPTVSQTFRPDPNPLWQANTAYNGLNGVGLAIIDGNGFIQQVVIFGTTGATEPVWNDTPYQFTQDGSVSWQNMGSISWLPNFDYAEGQPVTGVVANTPAGPQRQIFWCIAAGTSGSTEPTWQNNIGTLVGDGSAGLQWKNGGLTFPWVDLGPNTPIVNTATITDSNGYLQNVAQSGKSGATEPNPWTELKGAFTTDNTIVWVNAGAFAVTTTAPWQYGYAFASTDANGDFIDISNMSPPSVQVTVSVGGQVVIQGAGSGDPQVKVIPIYRTAQGGSTFLYLDQVPNPGAGKMWTYTDTNSDSALSTDIQAQVNGEGTPLPIGATCLAYHIGRIWAAVGNVVYASSGPDAVASGSSGNAGFDMTFTAQSKVIRFWVTPLGLIVMTVRDCYIITGDGAPAANGGTPLTMSVFVENLPLLNYDAFCVHMTTAYFLSGHKMVYSFDPGAGIIEASFPIADQIGALDPTTAYVTFHSGASGETAMYVSNGNGTWYRFSPTSAPESGFNWAPPGIAVAGASAIQSVETTPGTFTLLFGPRRDFNEAYTAEILMRDPTVNTDNGATYPAWVHVGNIVLAHSGQLAGLAWLTLESAPNGTATQVGIMLDEITEITGSNSAFFYPVLRTRQDPPNLPPSESLYSNRHSLLQNQNPVWCKSLQLLFFWPDEAAANELLTYTIFGQMWAEQRSQ